MVAVDGKSRTRSLLAEEKSVRAEEGFSGSCSEPISSPPRSVRAALAVALFYLAAHFGKSFSNKYVGEDGRVPHFAVVSFISLAFGSVGTFVMRVAAPSKFPRWDQVKELGGLDLGLSMAMMGLVYSAHSYLALATLHVTSVAFWSIMQHAWQPVLYLSSARRNRDGESGLEAEKTGAP